MFQDSSDSIYTNSSRSNSVSNSIRNRQSNRRTNSNDSNDSINGDIVCIEQLFALSSCKSTSCKLQGALGAIGG
jgi:hypothetical protein